jgi:hypothetical protein
LPLTRHKSVLSLFCEKPVKPTSNIKDHNTTFFMFLFLAIYKGSSRIPIPVVKFNRKHSQAIVINSIAMPTISALKWLKQ